MKTPQIRRHGTIKFGTVESTPIVFKGNLYRFEYCRPANAEFLSAESRYNQNDWSSFHFIDLKTGRKLPSFAKDHHLGCAYTDNGVMYAVGVYGKWTDTGDKVAPASGIGRTLTLVLGCVAVLFAGGAAIGILAAKRRRARKN